MQHILVVSQDEEYSSALIDLLRDEGYTVYLSESVETALEQVYSQKLDLMIVDIDSWKEEGTGVYKALQHELGTRDFSCIIIASIDLMTTVKFSLTFDDFIIKGGDPQEVPLRIKQSLWRQSRLDTENIVKVDNLVLDLNSYEVTINGKRVYLTYKEYELLKFLVLNRGRVFSREVLLDRVWGYDNYAGTRTVDIHVQRLRNKLALKSGSYIQTVRNVGYSFSAEKN
jgi:two-component system alkaline phosphatase synthesis response regulator PhoP